MVGQVPHQRTRILKLHLVFSITLYMASLFNFEFYIKFVKKFLVLRQKRVVCTKHLYLNNYKDAQIFCLFEKKKPSLPFFIVEKRYVSSIIAACCYSIEQNTSKTKTKVYHIRTCIYPVRLADKSWLKVLLTDLLWEENTIRWLKKYCL